MRPDTPNSSDGIHGGEDARLSTSEQLHTSIDAALGRWRRRSRNFLILMMSLHPWGSPGGWLNASIADDLRQGVVDRILKMLYPGDIVAELPGGELAVLCEDIGGADEALRIAHRFTAEASKPLALGGEVATPMVSTGVAMGGGVHSQAREVLGDALAAMQRAAERPGSHVELLSERLRVDLLTRFQSLNGLARGVDDGNFRLLYQPIISLGDGRLGAAEALLRWDKVNPAQAGPQQIISLAEETEWIGPIGHWVLRTACRQAAAWAQSSPEPLTTYVNVSPQQLIAPTLVSDVEQALSEAGLDPGRLGLEVTESSMVSDEAVAVLHRLRALGVRLSLDDFGTGYSCLSSLKRLPLDSLKLDRSFVAGLSTGSPDALIVATIVALAHGLGLDVVAEGVETAAQLDVVRDLGCDFAQGFHIARPGDPEACADWVPSGDEGPTLATAAMMGEVTAPLGAADTGGRAQGRQRTLFEGVPVAMYRTTPSGAILDANPALVELLGYPNLEALKALDVRDIYVDPSERERCSGLLHSRGVVIGFEEELLHFTGRTIWVHDNSQLVRDADGSVLFCEGALIDITARKRAVEALEHSEERYRNLFHRSPVPLWEEDFSALSPWLDDLRTSGVSDARRYMTEHPEQVQRGIDLIRIVDVNQAAVDLVGAAGREQMLGGIPTEVLNPDARQGFVEQIMAVWDGQRRLSTDIIGQTFDGNRIDCLLDWVVAPGGESADLSRVVVALTDITDQRRKEERLEALMRSKDELIASVSHELRTPLTAVAGFAHELRDRWDDLQPGEHKAFTELIAHQSVEMANIIEDLLVAARADIGKLNVVPAFCDLATQVGEVMAASGDEPAHRVQLRCRPARVWADPARVRQIIRNLLTNAQRYGGDHIEIETNTAADTANLVVRDDGPGIPTAQTERIFEPYERLHHNDNGQPGAIGIGLTVSRALARLMNGELKYLHSGGMPEFVLTLPTTPREDQASNTLDSPQPKQTHPIT